MSHQEAGKEKEAPVEKGYKTPGLRGAQTTTLFRAVNPELFIKPVRPFSVYQEKRFLGEIKTLILS